MGGMPLKLALHSSCISGRGGKGGSLVLVIIGMGTFVLGGYEKLFNGGCPELPLQRVFVGVGTSETLTSSM